MNETKRTYFQKDLLDWCSYAGVKLNWPDVFPIRTVLPLRVILAANCDPGIITCICKFNIYRFISNIFFMQFMQLGLRTRTLVIQRYDMTSTCPSAS